MNFQKFLGLAFCGAMLGGCAIHPQQEDFTRVHTSEVVQHIRCETRSAILDKAFALMAQRRGLPLATDTYEPAMRPREFGFLPADNGAVDLKRIYGLLYRNERLFFDHYIRTGIAYIFTFDSTEENNVGFAIDPIQTLTRGGVLGIQVGASANHSRKNSRNFTIAETFEDILTDSSLACGEYHPTPNYSYPISGKVGIYSVIDNFIDLNRQKALSKDDAVKAVLTDKVPLFGDTLQFTTTLQVSATPSLTINSLGSRFSLDKDTSFSPLARRTDLHTLAIGLSLEEKNPEVFPGDKKAKPAVVGKSLFLAPRQLSSPPLAPQQEPSDFCSSTPERRALCVAREQLLLNFYSRLAR